MCTFYQTFLHFSLQTLQTLCGSLVYFNIIYKYFQAIVSLRFFVLYGRCASQILKPVYQMATTIYSCVIHLVKNNLLITIVDAVTFTAPSISAASDSKLQKYLIYAAVISELSVPILPPRHGKLVYPNLARLVRTQLCIRLLLVTSSFVKWCYRMR